MSRESRSRQIWRCYWVGLTLVVVSLVNAAPLAFQSDSDDRVSVIIVWE